MSEAKSALAPRHRSILRILEADGEAAVARLAGELGVSEVTIRSDLSDLEARRLLRRVRGGARIARPARFEPPQEVSIETFANEKERIGLAAAAMIKSGDTIILDSGTTTLALARALPKTLHDVVAVTNSIDIAIALDPHSGVDVFVTGGRMRTSSRNSTRTMVAPMGTLLLEKISADIAFLCCAGIDARRGFTNANIEETEMKQAMMAAARRTVMLADGSKLGHIGVVRIARLAEVSALITDASVSGAPLEALQEAGLDVVIA
ncbi:DeoR/GlpR family DNA-binding transcription regulator [Aureimonas populi]|nr:DeoR/GlpR family DNA-binding transcription regulator [Aureimonas populi]